MTEESRLREWLREDHGIDLVSAARADGGADASAEVFRVVARDGAEYAVKLWLEPGPDGLRLSVTRWVSGRPALEGGLSAEQWAAFGRLLRRTHELPAASAPGLPREDYRPDRWVELFDRTDAAVRARATGPGADAAVDARAMGTGHDEAVRERAMGWGGDEVERRLVAAWSGARGDLLAARERAVRLGVSLRARDEGALVLCHADPHLGNVVVTGDDAVELIDWDDAVFAPAERDLMFVYGGVLAFAPVTERQRGWFFAGYGDARADPERLAYYRCVRALEDIAVPAAQILEDGPDRRTALDHVEQVLSPTGLLRQALG